jgi:hypothetical protein
LNAESGENKPFQVFNDLMIKEPLSLDCGKLSHTSAFCNAVQYIVSCAIRKS